MSSSGRLVVYPPSLYWTTCSAAVSTPSSRVSTDTPRQTVSTFDHFVTQWMSQVTSSLGSARNSSHVQRRGSSSSPTTEKSHRSRGVWGGGAAGRAGKPRGKDWARGGRAGMGERRVGEGGRYRGVPDPLKK